MEYSGRFYGLSVNGSPGCPERKTVANTQCKDASPIVVISMAKSQGIDIPWGVGEREVLGAGVGGLQDYLPVTYAITYSAAGVGYAYRGGKAAAVATAQGLYWTGNKAKEVVESTGGEFYAAPIDNDRGAGGVGIRWNF
jgi:hypothetical protein